MQIKQRLEYPIWKTPYFFIVGLFVFVKLVKAGTFTLFIDKPFFNKKINLTLKFFNFIFYFFKKNFFGNIHIICLIY